MFRARVAGVLDMSKTMRWLPDKCLVFIERLIKFVNTGEDVNDLSIWSSSDASEEEVELDELSMQSQLGQLPQPAHAGASSSAMSGRGKGLSQLGRTQSILSASTEDKETEPTKKRGNKRAAKASAAPSVIKRRRVTPAQKPTKNPTKAERIAQAKTSYQQLYEKCLVTRPDDTYGEDTPDQDTFKIDVDSIQQPPSNKLVRPPNKSYVKTLVNVMERRPYAAVAPLLLQVWQVYNLIVWTHS